MRSLIPARLPTASRPQTSSWLPRKASAASLKTASPLKIPRPASPPSRLPAAARSASASRPRGKPTSAFLTPPPLTWTKFSITGKNKPQKKRWMIPALFSASNISQRSLLPSRLPGSGAPRLAKLAMAWSRSFPACSCPSGSWMAALPWTGRIRPW